MKNPVSNNPAHDQTYLTICDYTPGFAFYYNTGTWLAEKFVNGIEVIFRLIKATRKLIRKNDVNCGLE